MVALPTTERAYYLDAFRGHYLVIAALVREGRHECEQVGADLADHGIHVTLVLPGERSGAVTSADVVRVWRRMHAGDAAVLEHADPVGAATSIAALGGVHKLVLVGNGLVLDLPGGERRSFADIDEIAPPRSVARVADVFGAGVPAVNLVAPGGLAEELLTYRGSGTLLTRGRYGDVRGLTFRDYPVVLALLQLGCDLGYLRPRDIEELESILPRAIAFFAEGDHPAGVIALADEPYEGTGYGEVEGLFTISRYQGEGVGRRLVEAAVERAREAGLANLFAVTSSGEAADFFGACGFVHVSPSSVPGAKWEGYPSARRSTVRVLSLPVRPS